MKTRLTIIIILILILFDNSTAQLFKVYGWSTRAKGEAEIVLWNSYIAKSNLNYNFFGENVSREGLLAHSIELEYGVTDRFMTSIYFDYEQPKDKDLKYIKVRSVFLRYRFGERNEFFFDPAIYVEYYIHKKSYKDYEELEIKFILEKNIGDVRIDLNPIVEKKTSGSKVADGLEFNYAAGVYYRKSQLIQPGLEFYGKMGEINNLRLGDHNRHFIFPTIDLRHSDFHWHLGAGWGITNSSDKFIIKSILSYKF